MNLTANYPTNVDIKEKLNGFESYALKYDNFRYKWKYGI